MPNFSVSELSLLLECHLDAVFHWTPLDGWHAARKLKLDILQLEHSISGTSVPVPKTLLKYLLNMLLPAVLETRLLAMLAAEAGQYLHAKDTPGLQLGGQVGVAGADLTALNADLTASTTPSAPRVINLRFAAPLRGACDASAVLARATIAMANCSVCSCFERSERP